MKMCAIGRPVAGREWGCPAWLTCRSWSYCDSFAAQFTISGCGHDLVPALQPRKDLNLFSGALAEGDVTQLRYLVPVEHVHSLELSSFHYGALWNQNCGPLAAREMRAPEQAGAETRVDGQLDFHEKTAAGRIGCRNDLHHLAGKLDIPQRVNRHWGGLPNMDEANVTFVYLSFEPIASRVFDVKIGMPGEASVPASAFFCVTTPANGARMRV